MKITPMHLQVLQTRLRHIKLRKIIIILGNSTSTLDANGIQRITVHIQKSMIGWEGMMRNKQNYSLGGENCMVKRIRSISSDREYLGNFRNTLYTSSRVSFSEKSLERSCSTWAERYDLCCCNDTGPKSSWDGVVECKNW